MLCDSPSSRESGLRRSRHVSSFVIRLASSQSIVDEARMSRNHRNLQSSNHTNFVRCDSSPELQNNSLRILRNEDSLQRYRLLVFAFLRTRISKLDSRWGSGMTRFLCVVINSNLRQSARSVWVCTLFQTVSNRALVTSSSTYDKYLL